MLILVTFVILHDELISKSGDFKQQKNVIFPWKISYFTLICSVKASFSVFCVTGFLTHLSALFESSKDISFICRKIHPIRQQQPQRKGSSNTADNKSSRRGSWIVHIKLQCWTYILLSERLTELLKLMPSTPETWSKNT